MNISILGIAGIPACYGGFETLAENLVKNNNNTHIRYTVFCSKKLYPVRKTEYYGSNLKYINFYPNGISSLFYDLICMLLSLHSDVMLILGVSGSLFLPLVRLLYRGRIITNIDGLEWKREKWNKVARFILRKSEEAAVKYSDIIIGDNQAIVDYVLQEYKKSIALIKYGADHVYKEYNKILVQEYPFCREKYAITVCRIEPENNINYILQAFSKQAKISLVMIGNWKNSDYGLELLNKYSQLAHIHLLDPVYDAERINFLRSHALVYIHGHSAGGTNPSVIEAMFLGIPIFAFDCTYNRYTTENQCIYWSNPDELYHYILQIDTLNLNDIGEKMKLVADDKYRWKIIASEYEALFDCTSSMKKDYNTTTPNTQ